jgi:hypothetical protein
MIAGGGRAISLGSPVPPRRRALRAHPGQLLHHASIRGQRRDQAPGDLQRPIGVCRPGLAPALAGPGHPLGPDLAGRSRLRTPRKELTGVAIGTQYCWLADIAEWHGRTYQREAGDWRNSVALREVGYESAGWARAPDAPRAEARGPRPRPPDLTGVARPGGSRSARRAATHRSGSSRSHASPWNEPPTNERTSHQRTASHARAMVAVRHSAWMTIIHSHRRFIRCDVDRRDPGARCGDLGARDALVPRERRASRSAGPGAGQGAGQGVGSRARGTRVERQNRAPIESCSATSATAYALGRFMPLSFSIVAVVATGGIAARSVT